MTKHINIEIKKTGFPVSVGEVELWFDTSIENLKRLSKINDIASKEIKRIREEYKHIDLKKELKNVDDIDQEVVNASFDMSKNFIKFQFDLILGDGTFDKVYKVHPDLTAIEKALTQLSGIVAKEISKSGIK